MIDIIYSILCHESPECLIDMIQNVKFFNKSHTIKIIIHSNEYMFSHISHLNSDPIISIYPIPWNKVKYTYDILEAHLQTFEYCKSNQIVGTYFIPLASNCMFHRQITVSEIEQILASANDAIDLSKNGIEGDNPDSWHWSSYLKNEKIIDILHTNNITYMKGGQFEGIIISYPVYGKIVEFIINNKIKESIGYNNVTFEEILLITLYQYITGKNPSYLCRVFWELPNYTPSISDITSVSQPCVKRVPMNINDPVREWIRSHY